MSIYKEIADLLLQLKEVDRRSIESYRGYCQKALNVLQDTDKCEVCGDMIDNGKFCSTACAWEHEQNNQEQAITGN